MGNFKKKVIASQAKTGFSKSKSSIQATNHLAVIEEEEEVEEEIAISPIWKALREMKADSPSEVAPDHTDELRPDNTDELRTDNTNELRADNPNELRADNSRRKPQGGVELTALRDMSIEELYNHGVMLANEGDDKAKNDVDAAHEPESLCTSSVNEPQSAKIACDVMNHTNTLVSADSGLSGCPETDSLSKPLIKPKRSKWKVFFACFTCKY